MSDTPIIGMEMKLYRNSATYASPTWVLCENVRDLTLNDTDTEAEANSRAGTFNVILRGLTSISADWDMLHKVGADDVDFLAIQTAKNSRAVIEFAFADGLIATVGTKYVRAICEVTKFDRSEPLEGTVTVSTSAKPSARNGGNYPSYVTVS